MLSLAGSKLFNHITHSEKSLISNTEFSNLKNTFLKTSISNLTQERLGNGLVTQKFQAYSSHSKPGFEWLDQFLTYKNSFLSLKIGQGQC